jgi:hypothetical protein
VQPSRRRSLLDGSLIVISYRWAGWVTKSAQGTEGDVRVERDNQDANSATIRMRKARHPPQPARVFHRLGDIPKVAGTLRLAVGAVGRSI